MHEWRVKRPARLLLGTTLALLFGLGFVWPDDACIPVAGASVHDWNAASFWYEPWGRSGVHKGIDVFAQEGRPVIAAVAGVVIYQGQLGIGGNVVAVLGPKWRVHYYAHLASNDVVPRFVARGAALGRVGTSGNAAGKPPHLHYAVISLVPLPWRYSAATQGWKQMFYLDPGMLLKHET